MLSVLKIRNIAIIESAEIEFSRGFNVLTGETGAGKSIILDSINAVLGFRTSRELIRTGEKEAEVTALFSAVSEHTLKKLSSLSLPDSPDGSVLVSRIIGADKNICRVNGALTTVTVLRELGDSLISIHGQQDNRELLNSETHIGYIDLIADNSSLFNDFTEKYNKLIEIKKEIKRLSTDKAEKARRIDILTYQTEELSKAEITPGEWDELRSRRDEMQNYEKIQGALSGAYSALSGDEDTAGAVALVSAAMRELLSVSGYSKDIEKLSSAVSDIYYELGDFAETLRGGISDDGFSEAELENVQNRLDLLYKLSKKYGETEEEMLVFLERASKELDEINFSDEKLVELNAVYEKELTETLESAKRLSASRHKASIKFSEDVCSELRFLDMPYVKFSVEFGDCELCENGIDTAQFLISANVGEEPKAIAKIASGGELSRIMLALKTVMANKDKIDTMIFDEIDSGVSGRAALKVAKKLKEVSKGRQVICVTHLSQLASFADGHYLIEKSAENGKTFTKVTPLDYEGREREIARIIGGGEITDTQLESAREMLLMAEKG